MPAKSETLRIATFNAELTREGPGLLLRDILTGADRQVEAASEVIATAAPDVILLAGFDYDLDGVALEAFAQRIAAHGMAYPHHFALRPNTGRASGIDLDGDGKLGGPGDAQGFGRFAGEGGMAVLSRLPIEASTAQDFSAFLWRDLPESLISGAALSSDAAAIQRLSTTGHWAVPVTLADGRSLTLLAFHATPPVFDGPEDRNGRRNHDEAAFWLRFIDGELPFAPPAAPFVILGDANLDPVDGDGRAGALEALLTDPRLQDPVPSSTGAVRAGAEQGGANAAQRGDPKLDTADWRDTPGPGNLRVDYVLPSADLAVAGSGVWWPAPEELGSAEAEAASRHRLVWVDVELP
ncbi:endonuclease/exonuclease/phosphatase family protein [Defluviimonas sp. WL0024]|uniref:Endonuclease/exonuclease/phosphatase family protein n=1 Tax=Albidovulum salinarum TaxID=2984153 RepID=A0ABT2X313_9RHOB|nr:endonuclease/exonuclease/phosphatase family protein [Defluviimonas sp. WL0024]MCU9848341.1 endonuclease/exonuclease/phosphatase family protein [Defluviimonas sp. WL0024]